ncbi:MAG TPA: arginine repressor [Candidatus Riflebacteria bacterium]|nr:arginine repressor [Candidatus Riflebacteria bacterium]
MNKQQRQDAIIKIIRSHKVNSQQMLLEEMARAGIVLTQATLSRDLKTLGVARQALEDGTYTYSMVEDIPARAIKKIPLIAGNAFLQVEFSSNIAVVKTLPGFASGLASTIDGLRLDGFIGSIAGDDTILLVVREGINRSQLRAELLEKLPQLGLKIHL